MTRLNVTIRNKMVNKAISISGVYDEFDALEGRRIKLAESIRVDSLGGIENIHTVSKLIKGINKKVELNKSILKNFSFGGSFAFKSNHELYNINLGGMRVSLQYNGSESEYSTPRKTCVYKDIVPKDSLVVYDADHEFTKEFLLIENDCKKLKNKREGLRMQISATLNQFTTFKNLLKAWPESKDLIPDDINEAKPQLPVVQVKDLNCLIGLPKGDLK